MTTFLRVLIGLAFLALVACAPVVVTPQPTPIVVTATPVPTSVPTVVPTSAPNVYFVPVNAGHDLAGPVQYITSGAGHIQVRRLVIPIWAEFVNQMNIIRANGDDDCGWIPPYWYAQDVATGQYLVEPEWLCGSWALAENNIELKPGRYILKMRYANIRLTPSEGEYWENGNFSAFPVVYTSDGNSYILPRQNMPMRAAGLEQIWVVETDRTRYIRVEWTWRITWPSTLGSFVIDDLEVLTAPPDFGADVVVKF